MTENALLIHIFFFISVTMSVYTIRYALKRGQRTGLLRSFLWIQLFLLLWVSGDFIRLFWESYRQKWILVRIEYSAICFISVTWLLLCLQYAESSWLTRRTTRLLWILPIFSYLAVLTNDFHHLFLTAGDHNFNQFGILFYIHAVSSYLYCLAGIIVLMGHSFKQFRQLRKQATLLIVAGLTPLVLNILIIFKVVNLYDFDFTPLSFNISSFIFIIGIFKYKFLDIIPIALRKIINHMDDAIVVCDNTNRIIEYNQALLKTFPELAKLKIGDSADLLLEVLFQRGLAEEPAELKNFQDDPDRSVNVELDLKKTRQWYQSNIQLIRNGKDILGRIITFHDLSNYKRLLEEINLKNSELTSLNRQLKEYTATVEELAVMKERNRLAREVHDKLEQNLLILVTLLELCKKSIQSDPQGIEAKLQEAIRFAIRGQEEARHALRGLAPVIPDGTESARYLPVDCGK
jgi:signal transduction histidine kinase